MKLLKHLPAALLCCSALMGAPLGANAQGFAGGPAAGYVPIDGNVRLPNGSFLKDTGAGAFEFCDGVACTNNFTLSAAGSTTARFNGGLQIGGSSTFYFLNRTNCQSPADGQLKCLNNAGSAAATWIGSTTNDNAAAGGLGEFVQSTLVQGSAVSLTNNTAANITSISLTAGDWDAWYNLCYSISVGATFEEASISATTATRATAPNGGGYSSLSTAIAPTGSNCLTGYERISVASTTSEFLVGFALFSSGTASGWGSIQARRAR